MTFSQTPIAIRFVLLALIWGSLWIGIKYQVGPVPLAWSAVWRLPMSIAVLVLAARLTGTSLRLSRPQHLFAFGLGMLQFFVAFELAYVATALMPSGLMAVCYATMVMINPLLARLFVGARVNRGIIIGGLLAIAGIALMFAREIGHFSWHDDVARGLILAMIAVFSAGMSSQIPLRHEMRGVPSMALLVWGMAYGCIACTLYALLFIGPPQIDSSPAYLISLLFTAIFGSSVAFILYFSIIGSHGPTVAAYTNIVNPVVALAWSTLLEGYLWTPTNIAGAILAVLGTWLAMKPEKTSTG
jgi:drug/metabolite transporter (DMT)-like permease